MADQMDDPYAPFNFEVTIKPDNGLEVFGAFSDVSGMHNEVTYADYRTGLDPHNFVRKVPLMNKSGEVTFKRGLIGSMDLFKWIQSAKDGDLKARATITIKLLSEDRGQAVATWQLDRARPQKWTGPTLAAKGASEVAMEELVVVCEDITWK